MESAVDYEEEKEILKEVREFVKNGSDIHSINVMDFKISKNYASGNSFSVANKANVWKRERCQVSCNILEPIVNSIVFRFTEDPFEFCLKDKPREMESPFAEEELTFQLSSALRETCIDGISYILAYKDEEGKIGFNRLNNFNVLYGDCKYADGKDCEMCVYVDKEKIDGPRPSRDGIPKSIQTVLNFKQNETAVMTVWKKTGKREVATYEIKGDKITNKVVQNLSRIPVVRFYGKEFFIENDKNWRGLYYIVKDYLRTMDYQMSLIQERIATAPTDLFLVAKESLGENLDDWTRLNDIPRAFRAYRSIDPKTGQQLPAPIPNLFIKNSFVGIMVEKF